ncbi:hypothetical protein HAX54_030151 [Datura stramonium]|uniref:Transposase TnpC homeodomain domain-containing protein n=1 Tax=Datura stramonium TaxID=4076 RepID=A0ABS8Y8F7_DATST|nr:hypothetical protein [Datura stramonium]
MVEQIWTLEAEYAGKHDAVKAEIEIVRKEKEDLRAKVLMLRAEVLMLRRELQGTVFSGEERSKLKVPEPKAYNGVNAMVAAEEGKKAEPKAKDPVAYEDDVVGGYRVIVPDPNRRVR